MAGGRSQHEQHCGCFERKKLETYCLISNPIYLHLCKKKNGACRYIHMYVLTSSLFWMVSQNFRRIIIELKYINKTLKPFATMWWRLYLTAFRMDCTLPISSRVATSIFFFFLSKWCWFDPTDQLFTVHMPWISAKLMWEDLISILW